ncbi:MAG: O-antigen ligase family protein [Bacillota bacterium]|nr:O-antigen ligase family protein [Bacillota bacterium]
MSRKKTAKGKIKLPAGNPTGQVSIFKTVGELLFNDGKITELTKRIFFIIMVSVLVILLFIGPFYRGLFFPVERLYTMILIFGTLVAWGVFRIRSKDGRFFSTPLDFCLIILLLAYVAAFFVAANKREALEEILKISSYIVVYLISIDICRHWGKIEVRGIKEYFQPDSDSTAVPPGLSILLHLLLAAATVITVASLGVPAGHWNFIGAYASNRIASPMGYANSAAAYMMASYLLAIGLAPLAAKWFRLFYLAPAALMLMTLVLTFSRGAWLLLPPLVLLLILLAAPGQRLRTFLYLFATAVSAVPAALITDQVFRSNAPARAWLIIIPAVVLAILLGYLAERYIQMKKKGKIILAVSAAFVFVLLLFLLIGLPAISPLHLEMGADEQAEATVIKQVITGIAPGETYELNMAVDATVEESSEEGTSSIWGLRVLGGVPGYQDVELLNHRDGTTEGWEEKAFTFKTAEDMTRLEVQLYNDHPGSAVTVREVTLLSDREQKKLRFVMNRVLPKRFYERLFSYSLNRNMDRRFELFHDALKIIKDYPLLGTGGGGWEALYHSYQEQHYTSMGVHNHFLQVWVEAGLFGFLAFVGIWISFAVAFVKNCLIRKAPPRLWQYWTAVLVPVVALGAHSVIDWNFDFMAVCIFFFVFLGAGRSLDQTNWFKKNNESRSKERRGLLIGSIAIIIGVGLFVFTINLHSGLKATWHSQELMEDGNLKKATIELEKAISLDPLRAENYHNLGVLEEEKFNRTKLQANLENALHMAEKAYDLEPYNPNYVGRYGSLLFSYVDAEEGLVYIDRAIELKPFDSSYYVQAAWTRLSLIEYLIDAHHVPEAEKYLAEIEVLAEQLETALGDSKPLYFMMGRALYLLGEPGEAVEYLADIKPDEKFYAEAQLLLDQIGKEENFENKQSR